MPMKAKRPSTRSQEAGSPRDRILDRAIELFAAHGFEALTMRMLGDAVGLDNSSLYRHFASKTELANAVLDRVAGNFLAAIEQNIDGTRPVTLGALENVAAAAGTYFFDRPPAARLMMHWMMSIGANCGSATNPPNGSDPSEYCTPLIVFFQIGFPNQTPNFSM